MAGQINPGSKMGQALMALCTRPDVRTIVEIGTWNGEGSTQCIRRAIESSDDTRFFYSLELDFERWKQAMTFHQPLPKNMVILHGRVSSLGKAPPIDLSEEELGWWHADKKAEEEAEDVLHLLPDKIDLLLLDGGEFTSLQDFKVLAPRSKYIMCDDVRARKFRGLSVFTPPFFVRGADLEDRNGWAWGENRNFK